MADTNRTYTVATFQVTNDFKKNTATREYVIVETELTWDQAKKTKGENRGSWIFAEMYKEG